VWNIVFKLDLILLFPYTVDAHAGSSTLWTMSSLWFSSMPTSTMASILNFIWS